MSKYVQSGRMSLVDPREFLSRNDSAAAGRGVALESVLELISAEDWGVPGWSRSQMYDVVNWWKCCFKKSSFEESWYVSCGGFFVSNLFSNNIRGACIVTKILLKSDFLKRDPFMRISFSTKSKSPRCEGKVVWSCSVLRARPHQFSKPALAFWGGKVEDVYTRIYIYVICFIYCEKSLFIKYFSGCSCSVLQIEPQQENRLSSKLGRNFGGGNILRKNL